MSERDIKRLLALVEKQLGKSWVEIAEWLREQNSLDAIEARLLALDYQGVIAEVESAAKRFASETHEQFIRSGRAEAKWLDKQLPDKLVRFDIENERAIRAAERNKLELVRGLTEETRETAHRVIYDGQRAHLNPRTIARDLRDSITLTPHQAQHVANMRRSLESGDYGDVLGRQLRDRRYDKILRRAAKDGTALTEKQIDKMVERYRLNYIGHRAETIARTESARNVHAGLEEAGRQAIERGDVEADQLVKEWIHAGRGENSREDHVDMDGTQVKFADLFELPDGTRMKYPGDPAGGAKHVANCRCTYATTLDVSVEKRRASSLAIRPGEGMYAHLYRAAGEEPPSWG